jgi:ribosomal protein S18 acetylase RimI-like enzyme
VWERNLKAIAFYRKCGLSVVGEHSFMLGLDQQRDLLMVAQQWPATADREHEVSQ